MTTKAKSQKWIPLEKGDIVDIVAPASHCAPERLNGAIRFLIDWGLKPRVPQKIFGKDVICANEDGVRFEQLMTALTAEDSKAVWCLRGGYGSNRLVPELLKKRAPKIQPKLFIGLSDITTLNLFLNQEWGWAAIHGPMLDRLGRGETKPVYLRELQRVYFGETSEIAFTKLKPLNEAARVRGEIRGPVTGGNIVTLQSSLGTKLPWETKGKILFMEEIGERGYRVDRILEHFRQAGVIDKARAIVLGDFTGGEEPDGKSRVPKVIRRFASELKIPVFSGIQSGHGAIQRPLPLGTPSVLKIGESTATLTCRTGAGR